MAEGQEAARAAQNRGAGRDAVTRGAAFVAVMWSLIAVAFVPVLVLIIGFTWNDAESLPFVIGGAVASCVIAVMANRKSTGMLALVNIDCFMLALCVGLAVAEFPSLRGVFSQDALARLGTVFAGSGWVGPIVALGVSLVGWFGSKLDAWQDKARWKNALWWLRLFIGTCAVAELVSPGFFSFPIVLLSEGVGFAWQYSTMPWLLALCFTVGPIALVTVVEHKHFVHKTGDAAGEGRIGRAAGIGALIAAWVTARCLLFPSLSLLRGYTWDTFALTALPFVGALCSAAFLLPGAYALCLRGACKDGSVWGSLTSAPDSQENGKASGMSAAEFALLLKQPCWQDYVIPLLLGGAVWGVDCALRHYIAYGWVPLAVYLLLALRYACRFADGKVERPERFCLSMILGSAFFCVEMLLISNGFATLCIALPVTLWLVSSRWKACKAGKLQDRAFFQWVILACAVCCCAAMVNTGWSVGRLAFAGACTAVASFALWATFHQEPTYQAPNLAKGGMFRIRATMAGGFAVLMLVAAFSSPGAPSIGIIEGSGAVAHVVPNSDGYTARIVAGHDDRAVSAQYAASDELVISKDEAHPLGSANTVVPVRYEHLAVWVTYEDGITTRSDFWVNLHRGW